MFKRIQKFLNRHKKALVSLAVVSSILCFGAMCFADEGATGGSVASTLDFSGITTALTSSVTPADILAIIAKVIGYCIPFVLAWFGFRFLWSKFRGAVTRGKM